jgi:hypothetical protein
MGMDVPQGPIIHSGTYEIIKLTRGIVHVVGIIPNIGV